MTVNLNPKKPSFYSKLQPHLPHITLWIVIFTGLVWLAMAQMMEVAPYRGF